MLDESQCSACRQACRCKHSVQVGADIFLIIYESQGASGVALFVIHLWTSVTAPAVKQKERGSTGIDSSVQNTVLYVKKCVLIVPDPDNINAFRIHHVSQ